MKLFSIFRIASEIAGSPTPISGRWLFVFDFDDTLARTGGKPWVRNKFTKQNEKRIEQKEPYKLGEDEEWDWREFTHYLQEPITPKMEYVEKLKECLNDGNADTIILTARSEGSPILKYLKENFGISIPRSDIFALGSSDPLDKAYVVRGLIDDYHYSNVRFWDDVQKNVAAVGALLDEYGDDVHIDSILVPK